MNRNRFRIALVLLLAAVLALSGCQGRTAGQNAPGGATAAPVTPVEAGPTSTPRPTATPRPSPTATLDPQAQTAAEAEQAARGYFAALEGGDFEQAASVLSDFSLMVAGMSRETAAAGLQEVVGAGWSDFDVVDTRPLDDQTMLVTVTYTAQAEDEPEPVEAIWALRQEDGLWRVNWGDLIDFTTLYTRGQTVQGITFKPVRMVRYTDLLRLELIGQNRNQELYVFGQSNEILARFYFGDQAVDVEEGRIVLPARRSVPDAVLELPGLYEAYPDSVEIRRWVNSSAAPWYTFSLR